MAAGAIEAGRAVLKLSLDDSELGKKFSELESKVRGMASRVQSAGLIIGGIGAAITAPLAVAVNSFINVGSALKDMSDRTGASVESLSELKFAAEQSGTSLGVVERAMVQMVKNGLDPRQFDEIAARIAAIEDPAERARAAIEAFGKAGPQLLPLLKDLQDLRAEARLLGVTMSSEAAANAEVLGDALDKVKLVAISGGAAIGAALAPQLTRLSEGLATALGVAVRFVSENENLTVIAGTTGAALLGLGTVMNVVAVAARGLATAVRLVGVALTFLAAHPVVAAILVAAAAVLYLTDGFGLLSTEAKQSGKTVTEATRAKTTAVVQMEKDAANKIIEIAREKDRKIQEQIAESNRKTISLEQSFQEERRRQRLTALERFAEDNAKKLKEAEELQRDIFLRSLSPQRRGQILRDEEETKKRQELERQFKLLQDIGQLRQSDKLRGVLDRANIARQDLAAGRAPNESNLRALGFVQGDAGKDARLQLGELKKHTTSLQELERIVRDNIGAFAVGNN